jgi:MFS family permease
VTCTLLATMAGVLVSPVAGAIADRADQRLLLLTGETGQGVVYAVMAVARPPLPVLLPLVALASLLAAVASPAGKSSVSRLVPAERRSQANALLSLAMNLQIIVGPAAGGVLAGIAGAPAAFAVNAASFWISALLLTRLGPLPPLQDDNTAATGGAPSPRQPGLLADTAAGLRYAAQAPLVRALAAGTFLFVAFASMDNVALVFLVKRSLHGDGIEYGMLSATFGAGMVAASVALARWARCRPGAFWLIGGVISGAAGAVATGLAPTAVLAGAAQAVAGAGNSADLVGTDTLLQQRVPAVMLGRAFSLVYGAAQLASVVSYGLAGPLVALAGPRAAFLVAGAGALAGLGLLVPGLRAPDTAAAAPEPVSR